MAMRVYFCFLSLVILVLCSVNYGIELTPSWKTYQREYHARLSETFADPQEAEQCRHTSPKFQQIYNKELGIADRCMICHLGIDSPPMATAPNPYKKHPGDLLKSHPPEKFGCTVCHEGQGMATTREAAHGHEPHWDRPLLTGEFIQATCTKCHREQEIPQAPVLTEGRKLMRTLGCVGCHKAGDIVEQDMVGPRLTAIGSKVSRKWLNKWLTNPNGYLPQGKMPHYQLAPPMVNALAAYLMTFRDEDINKLPEQEGDFDDGATVYREAQCIVCHITKVNYEEKPVGGTIGPDLRKIGNKVNARWLAAFLRNPHAFLPNTKMPRYHFTEKEVRDLVTFAMEEWVDYELLDVEEQEPETPPATETQIQQGKLLYAELGCAGCHDLRNADLKPSAPDLTFIGSKPVHDLDFGDARVRHTLPDFLYTKLKTPKAVRKDFHLPLSESPIQAIWKDLKPTALFSDSATLPNGSQSDQLKWILKQAQQAEILKSDPQLPEGTPSTQTAWLLKKLNEVDALSPLKMPDFQLSDEDAKALTIALMSLSADRVASRRYEVPSKPMVRFNPVDEFGSLERRYRCLSCHTIRGAGDRLASDLTWEGSRVNSEWLYHYLNKPYSMRRTITIAMPIFHFSDEESRFMAEYMSRVFVDSRIGEGWKRGKDKADAERGKILFDEKGCIACHQLHEKGGDVGPSLTTQVPEFPQGTWVGDKLTGGWIYEWLKDPQAILPETLEPNLGLSDQQILDFTAYILSLKNPEFQKQPEKTTK
ncbi:MAG: c-type cytochrome [Planctomycetes bacterium]|nr:c-type cytochrome [Planctomycetota bacterium]